MKIAETLGVTGSRISQPRAEALVLLRDALHRELDREMFQPAEKPAGRANKRREASCAAVADRHAAGVRRHPATRQCSTRGQPQRIGAETRFRTRA